MLNLEICIYSRHLNDKFEPGQVAAVFHLEVKSETASIYW